MCLFASFLVSSLACLFVGLFAGLLFVCLLVCLRVCLRACLRVCVVPDLFANVLVCLFTCLRSCFYLFVSCLIIYFVKDLKDAELAVVVDKAYGGQLQANLNTKQTQTIHGLYILGVSSLFVCCAC